MPNRKGFFDMHQPMSKTQPAKPGGHSANYNGDGHDFNEKAKVTAPGAGYVDMDGNAFNGAQKQASLDYLKNRNQEGIEVRNFTGTHQKKRDYTNNVGPTAYNNRPISEVYSPATSQKIPSPNAVVRPVDKKKELQG